MTVAENADRSSFVLLQVGERRFALLSNIVTELAPPVRLHTFPHTSPLVAGVIVRRGHIVPVYVERLDLHRVYRTLVVESVVGSHLEGAARDARHALTRTKRRSPSQE